MTPGSDSADARRLQPLGLPDAQAWLRPQFLSRETAQYYFECLLEETPWEERKIFVHGKSHVQPRLVAWYGDPHAVYEYSGDRLQPLPWTPRLQELRSRVEQACEAPFNSVLLNLYRDQNDRVGWHSDDEPELGRQPTIASVSLGETRELLWKRREKSRRGVLRIALTHGSLLLMRGDTQRNWRHAIASESRPCGPRISLTFRQIRRGGV